MTADVSGDGNLDVIAVTDNGDIWILDGQTGKSLPNYPIRTGYQFRSTPTLIDVSPSGDGLHMVFTSKEGEVGIVNLRTFFRFWFFCNEQRLRTQNRRGRGASDARAGIEGNGERYAGSDESCRMRSRR